MFKIRFFVDFIFVGVVDILFFNIFILYNCTEFSRILEFKCNYIKKNEW